MWHKAVIATTLKLFADEASLRLGSAVTAFRDLPALQRHTPVIP